MTVQNIIISFFLTAAFGIGLFFGGYQDIIYAPAILALLLATLVALVPVKRPALEFPKAMPAILLFAFWAYVTLSLSWSQIPFASLVTWLIFLTTPLTFLALLTSSNRTQALNILGGLLITALCALAFYAIYQYITLGGKYQGRAHLPLPNPNSLGGLLAMAVPPMIAFTLVKREKQALICHAATFIILAGVFATGSRGAIIALLIALAVQFLILRHSKTPLKKLLPLLVGAALIFGAMNMTGRTAITERLGNLAAAPLAEKEVIDRIALWESAVEMVKDAPLLGRGLGTFFQTYPAYRDPIDRSMGNWVHMDPLQFAVEMGIAAPLLFYLFLGSILLFTIRALKNTENNSTARFAIAGTFCGLLVIALQCHTTFHMYIMPILVGCGFLLAVWYVFVARTLPQDNFWLSVPLSGLRKAAFITATSVTLLCIAAVTISAAAGSYYTLKARDAIEKGSVTDFTDYVEKATLYGPVSFIDPQVQIAGFYADIAHASIFLHTPEEQQKMVTDVQDLLATAESYNPHWAEINHKRGVFYSKIDQSIVPDAAAKAEESWLSALRKNPMHYRARLGLAEFYIEQGRALDAYNIIDAGMRYPASQGYLDQFAKMRAELAPLADIQQNFKRQEQDE